MNFSKYFQKGKKIFRAAIRSLWRKKMTTAISIFSLAILFSIVHFSFLARDFAAVSIDHFQKKIDLVVFLEPDASDFRISAFRQFLNREKTAGKIIDFWEFSKTDALAEFQKNFPAEARFLEKYKVQNPLRDIFGVIPPPDIKKVAEIRAKILDKKWAGTVDLAATARKNEKNFDRISRFLKMTHFFSTGFSIAVLFFVGAAAFLVFYLTTLFLRSKTREIAIMRLVGARFWFLRAPFLLESFLIATAAFLLSVGLFLFGFDAEGAAITNFIRGIGVEKSFVFDFFQKSVAEKILFLDAAILFPISFLAAFLAINRAMRRENLSDF